MKILVEGGADLDVLECRATLHEAAYHGNVKVMKLLFGGERNNNVQDSGSRDLLHNAVANDHHLDVGVKAIKAVRKLASLKDAPDLLLTLNNEMSELLHVVGAIQDVLQRQQSSGMPFHGYGAREVDIDTGVANTLRQAKETYLELEALSSRLNASGSGSGRSFTFNELAWLREQKQVRQIQKDLRNLRPQLAVTLGVLDS